MPFLSVLCIIFITYTMVKGRDPVENLLNSPKISNIPKLGRSLDKVIFMYAATSILGVLTVMLSPLMVFITFIKYTQSQRQLLKEKKKRY